MNSYMESLAWKTNSFNAQQLREIGYKADNMIKQFKAFGVGSGLPRVQDMWFELRGMTEMMRFFSNSSYEFLHYFAPSLFHMIHDRIDYKFLDEVDEDIQLLIFLGTYSAQGLAERLRGDLIAISAIEQRVDEEIGRKAAEEATRARTCIYCGNEFPSAKKKERHQSACSKSPAIVAYRNSVTVNP